MSLARKILSDSIFSALSNCVSIVRGLVAIPLITKLLGTGQYGIWTILLSFVTIFKTVGGAHLHGALIRYQSADRSAEQSYSDTLCLTLVIAATLALLLLGPIRLLDVDRLVGADVTLALTVATVLMASEMVYRINWNFPRARGDIRFHESARVAKLLVETIALVVVFLNGGGILAGLLALIAVSVLANAALFYYVFTTCTVPAPDPSRFRTYVSFGLPMVPKDLSGYVLSHSDKYLLLFFLSPAAVGVYSVAYGVSTTVQRLSSVLNPTLYPTIAGAWDDGRTDEIRDVYRGIFRYYTILIVPAVVGLAVLAEPLLRVVSTDTVAADGAPLVPLLALAFTMRGYETVTEYILTAAEETNKMAVATGVTAALNIALNVALIPTFGLLGATVTTLLSQLVFTALIFHYSRAHIPIALPWRILAKAIVCAAVMGAALLHVPLALTDVQRLAAYPPLGATVYFLAMGLLGELPVTELRTMVNSTGQ